MKILLRSDDESNRLLYTCDFINHHPLNNRAFEILINTNEEVDLSINYQEEESQGADFSLVPQNLLFQNKESNELFANAYTCGDQEIYSVETKKKNKSSFLDGTKISFDIFETIFFHISRIEEIKVDRRWLNEREQIKEDHLFLIKSKLNKKPVVDLLIAALVECFTQEKRQQKSAVCMSHDIDFILKYKSVFSCYKSMIKAVLRFQNPFLIYKQYLSELQNLERAPYNNFEDLLLKQELSSKKIYFLMGGDHKYDNSYDLDHPIFKRAISLATERNYDIGIHPSYKSWKSKELIKREKERLEGSIGKEITIARQHYLHFDVLQTPGLLLKNGIIEDSSLGYTRHIGFRCGTGYPYYLYDFKEEKKSKLLERPLAYMESAALYSREFVKESISFFDANKMNTMINCNFHNSRFDPLTKEGIKVKEVYAYLKR